MAPDTKTISLTNVTNSNAVETTFSPNAGELWYVDEVRHTCDGTGAGNNAPGGWAGICSVDGPRPPAADPIYWGNYGGSRNTNSTATQSNNVHTGKGQVDSYLTADEELCVGGHDTDGSAVDVVVHLRRVL